MAKKVKVKVKKKEIFCDPAVCDYCQYICEGDFICDRKPVPLMVIEDWVPTNEYLWCQKRRKRDGN